MIRITTMSRMMIKLNIAIFSTIIQYSERGIKNRLTNCVSHKFLKIE